MRLNWGEKVVIVANPHNKNNAAFKRWKKGEKEVYVVCWTSWRGDRFSIQRLREGGRTDNHWYDVTEGEILPIRIADKQLEDYA